MNNKLHPDVARIIELVHITNQDVPVKDLRSDSNGTEYTELWDLLNKIHRNVDELIYNDVSAILRNLPLGEDYLRAATHTVTYADSFPCKEVWDLSFEQNAFHTKLDAMSYGKTDESNCCYFSFAPELPILEMGDFVKAMKKFSNPTFRDISNILFFMSWACNGYYTEYMNPHKAELKELFQKHEIEIIDALKAKWFRMRPKYMDESAPDLVDSCNEFGLSNLKEHLVNNVFDEQVPEAKRKLIIMEFWDKTNEGSDRNCHWTYEYVDDNFRYRELASRGFFLGHTDIVDPIPYENLVANPDVLPEKNFGPLMSQQRFMKLHERYTIFIQMIPHCIMEARYE